MTYTILNVTGIDGETQQHIMKTNEDGSKMSFPSDANNPNYEEYQAWVAEGNTPEEAE